MGIPLDKIVPFPFNAHVELKREIKLVPEGKDPYKKAGKTVKGLVFKYPDNHSSERVWNMIDELLSDKANLALIGDQVQCFKSIRRGKLVVSP